MRRTIAAFGMACGLVFGLIGCGPREEQGGPTPNASTREEGTGSARAARADARPSIVLVVLDTTRADAISAYGEVEGTTPTVDALAASGTRFTRAFAPSPWTVSSHATLFSGLRVDEHGVGLDGVYRLDDTLPVLAEVLAEGGYETAGFAENALVSEEFGLARGFEHFAATDMGDVVRAAQAGDPSMQFFSLAARVRRWAEGRDVERPAFVFVNIMDAHDPYSVRDSNPWVPEGTPRRALEGVVKRHTIPSALCRRVPSREDTAMLRGLYLGDVAAADAKLRDVLAALRPGLVGGPVVTIVTADHGEHLGEHDLFGHRFSVRTPALQIPLVIEGAPDLSPGVSDAPVGLRALHASIRCWAQGEDCGRSLAAAAPEAEAEPILSIWSDASASFPPPVLEQLGLPTDAPPRDVSRAACGPEDPVFGELVSLIRYPLKVNWAGGDVQSLHDLSWDPDERLDQRERAGERGEMLAAELRRFVETRVLERPDAVPTELSDEAKRTLRALGYAD